MVFKKKIQSVRWQEPLTTNIYSSWKFIYLRKLKCLRKQMFNKTNACRQN